MHIMQRVRRKNLTPNERRARILMIEAFMIDHRNLMKQERVYQQAYLATYRTEKTCAECLKTLPLDLFEPHPTTRDGYRSCCKRCQYDNHVKPNLGERRKSTRAWRKSNPQSVRRSREKDRAKPHNRIRGSLTRRLKQLLGTKTERTSQLIGCSPKELVAHLESLWLPGMSWDNYGQQGWHIDHIKPCRAFDLTVKEERLACFHHTNLQPLWGGDNIAKSDTLPDGTRARDLS